MINNLLYIVGAPGVGKSTLASELTRGWDQEVMRAVPVPHVRLRHPGTRRLLGLELGVPRPQFPGTDTLAMDISPRALQFLSTSLIPFVLGEGSRLATRPFIGELARVGVAVTLVRLTADETLLTERWQARGSKQNPSWRKGANTRADRLASWFETQTRAQQHGFRRYLELDATGSTPEQLADQVRDVFPLIDLRESVS